MTMTIQYTKQCNARRSPLRGACSTEQAPQAVAPSSFWFDTVTMRAQNRIWFHPARRPALATARSLVPRSRAPTRGRSESLRVEPRPARAHIHARRARANTGTGTHTHCSRPHAGSRSRMDIQTDTLALLPSVKRQVFCGGDRLKKDKHKAWATTSRKGHRPQKDR